MSETTDSWDKIPKVPELFPPKTDRELPSPFRVVNVRKNSSCKALPTERFYAIHRGTRFLPGNRVLCNIYPMKDESNEERQRVIRLAKERLDRDVLMKGPIYMTLRSIALEHLRTGQPVALGCFCAPLACHGDDYVVVLNDILKELREKMKTSSELEELKSFEVDTDELEKSWKPPQYLCTPGVIALQEKESVVFIQTGPQVKKTIA